MDFVKDLIAEKGATFVAPLVQKLGFSEGQAKLFVPVAIKALMDKFTSADEDEGSPFSLSGLLGGDDGGLDDVVEGVDAAAVAQEVGIEESKAKAGLKEIGPTVVDELKSKGMDAVLGALGGKDSALGGLGRLAGGLF